MSDVEKRFTSHRVDEMQGARIRYLREQFKDFALMLERDLPPGRERAIVLTHVEEASFMATAAIAREGCEVDTGVCPIPKKEADGS